MVLRVATILLAAGLAGAPAAAEGPLALVKDGDTLRLGVRDIRLFGIDAPESRQTCARADGTPWPCGRVAQERLAELVGAGPVRCRPRDTDRYGRLVSVCTAAGVDLGGRLVEEGLARAYTAFSDDYVGAEETARAAGLGLWQGISDAPWDYRAEARAVAGAETGTQGFEPAAAAAPPAGCDIKGNISAGGARIYHLPGTSGYASTRIDTTSGEAWFCDEAAALAAGFRPPRGVR